MKKYRSVIFLVLVLIVSIILPSCGIMKDTSSDTSEKSSKTSAAITNSLSFYKYTGYFGLSLEKDEPNNYLCFYGELQTSEKNNDNLNYSYNAKDYSIDLYNKDEKVYSSSNIDWRFNDRDELSKKFTLSVSCPYHDKNPQQIDQIVLHSKEGDSSYEIGNYQIDFFKIAPVKKFACVETPLTQLDLSQTVDLSYVIMTVDKMKSEPSGFKMEIPPSTSIYSIKKVEWHYDENSVKRVKDQYLSMGKTPKELENLKAYEIDITLNLKEKTNVVFQPVISAIIDGEREYCTTSLPFNMEFISSNC